MVERVILVMSIGVVVAILVAFAVFVAAYGRFPTGGSEVWNWLFG